MRLHLSLLSIGIAIGLINLRGDDPDSRPPPSTDWPSEFEGLSIEQVPLSDTEQAFAASFPGAIGVFKSPDGRQVILRRVDRPTRRLHSSATCLTAAGFRIGEQKLRDGWRCYQATRGEQMLEVREQITAEFGEGSWTDVSDWFWDAVFHRGEAPWIAVTVLIHG
ncbi:MAG: hypothetical protein ACI9UA_001509 [Pseudoalteromonas tetraodonis]|jgi:hypothetical protein